MKTEDIRKLTIEETADSLKLTVRYESLDVTAMASRRLQDCILANIEAAEDQNRDRGRLIKPLEQYREIESTIQITVDREYCYITTNTYGRDVVADIENIFNNASTLFLDDEFNTRMMDFLKKKFPNHFERNYAHENLLLDYKNGLIDGYIMSGDFYAPDDAPESFYPALLMLTAYAFPALYTHYSGVTKRGHIMGMFSDYKLSYESFMSSPTEAILADKAFRTRRKFFRKISSKMTVSELSLAYQLAEIVTADDLEYALREVNFQGDQSYIEAWYNGLAILPNFSPSVRRRLIRSLFEGAEQIEDAFEMAQNYATDYSFFKGVKSVDELHERALSLIPEITDDRYLSAIPELVYLNREITVPDTDLTLSLLVNQKDFVSTGKVLHTCIGSISYFEKSLRGESYCYQIFENDDLIGALEISRAGKALKVAQCTGYKNSPMDRQDLIFGALRRCLKAESLKRASV